jgi:hypothetical protein
MNNKTDFRTMFDKDYIGAWDLDGDRVVTITGVEAKKIKNAQEKEERKPIISLAEFGKKMVCNVTNANVIANLYGKYTEGWRGQRITIYPTQVQAFGKMQDCIRIRPGKPAATTKQSEPELALTDADGVVTTHTKGGDWLAAFETLLNDSPDHEAAGKLWDANSDVFYKIQAGAAKGENAKAIDACARIAALAKQKMTKPE